MTIGFYPIKKQHLVPVLGLVGIAAALSIAAILAFPVQTALSDHTPDDVVCPTTKCVNNADVANNAIGSNKIINGQVGSADLATGLQLTGNVCIDNPTLCVNAASNALLIGGDTTFDGDGTGDKARVVLEPGLLTLNDNRNNDPVFQSLSGTFIERAFLKINCQDRNGCNVSISGTGSPGQLLILQNANTSLTCVAAPGFVRIQESMLNDLGDTRVLDNRSDKLTLIYDGNAWTELAFADNGGAGIC